MTGAATTGRTGGAGAPAPESAPESVPGPAPAAGREAGFLDALRAEWAKMATLRSTAWTLLVTLAVAAGFGALFGNGWATTYHEGTPAERAELGSATETILNAHILVQLAVGVLGVLVVCGEYATGTMRVSLTAVPVRSRLLAAKCLVVGVVALLVGQAAAFLAYGTGRLALDAKNTSGVAVGGLGDPGVVRAVIGCGLYLALIGLLGVGLGVLLRATAGAISALVVTTLIWPLVTGALPGAFGEWLERWWPTIAGARIMWLGAEDGGLAPWTGLLVLVLTVGAVLAAAFTLFRQRDA